MKGGLLDRDFYYTKIKNMIIKFQDLNDSFTSLEIENTGDFIDFRIECYETQDSKRVSIPHQSLFELIGQLLRIQADIKKGGNHVR